MVKGKEEKKLLTVGGTGQWRIEARAFLICILRITTPFAHNFWALVNPDGDVVNQIHGLAVDLQTGRELPRGNSNDLLQVVIRRDFPWAIVQGQPTIVAAAGDAAAIKARWYAAVSAKQEINDLRLHYPNLSEQLSKPNSNTVFHTMGNIMGFPIKRIGPYTIALGVEKVISQKIVDKYIYKEICDSSPY